MQLDELKNQWQLLANNYPTRQPVIDDLFDEIVSAYSELHRFYHNLNHIAHFFNELDSCGSISNETLLAVWYHDLVYRPGAKNNERKSADQAKLALNKLGLSRNSIERVDFLIMATESHLPGLGDKELNIFLDADMAILGSPPEKYQEYLRKIRMEYSKIPNFLFNRGRSQFLRSVIQQDCIFLSEYFREKYELAARENIKSELHTLRNSV
ncbi:MAG: hypothetical protein OQK04_18780 [Kangiellaceae bacterium]|nr:hypothetical protein [Kangiellaceae bacterium]MCW9000763.1 hypothetical protein [Kangiellaceae bacterium]